MSEKRAPRLAWLGTGLLGEKIVARLLARGFAVTVWNRTREKAARLAPLGAGVTATPAGALTDAGIVGLTLADAAAIRAALLDDADARAALAGRLVVQMGTIAPEESRALANEVVAAGGRYLEAPVLGSRPEAEAGKLLVMAAGAPEDFALARPMLEALAGRIVHLDAIGQAAAMKLALNALIATETAAFAMALAFVERAGVPTQAFMDILRASALYAPTFDKKLPRMQAHDYARPNFPVRHLAKDARLFAEVAARLGVDAAPIAPARAWLAEAMEKGMAEEDYSAIAECARGASGGA